MRSIENEVEEDRWVYSNECNEWEGGGLRNNYKPKQNTMLENYVCNDKEDNHSEGQDKGDKNNQYHANLNMNACELGKGNFCLAEECGVDDCEGQFEENTKATIDINDYECNMITDTEDIIGIIFQLEGNDVQVSLRDYGSYMKFNKDCYHKGYKCSTVHT